MTSQCQGHAAESARAEHMKEAERLADAYANTFFCEKSVTEIPGARAALLAHIQRGAVPEGRQVVPMPEPVARILEWRGRLALSPQPSARTFDEFPTSETFPAKKDAYWSDGKLLVLADEARTYGDAREAAGYARGRAEAGRDAERRGQFLIECDDVALRVGPEHLGLCDAIDNDGQPYQSQALADEITALRGEVKP